MRNRRASAQLCSLVGLERAGVFDLFGGVAEHFREIGGGDIAGRGCRGFLRVRIDNGLVGAFPAARLDALALQPRVNFGIELQHRRAIGHLQHRRAGGRRFRHPDLVVLRKHNLPVGFGAAQQEIPIGGFVLHDLLQRRGRRFHVFSQPMRTEKLLHDVAVFLVDEVAALPGVRQLHGIAAAFDGQRAPAFAHLYALLDDQSLEDRFILRAVTELDLDGLPGHEAVGVADRKRARCRFAVLDLDAGRRNPVELLADRDGHHLQVARHILSVDQQRQGADIGRGRRRNEDGSPTIRA
jgi:hypothetical protein